MQQEKKTLPPLASIRNEVRKVQFAIALPRKLSSRTDRNDCKSNANGASESVGVRAIFIPVKRVVGGAVH